MFSGRKISIARRSPTRRLSLEMLETRRVLASLPYGAMPDDTAEFMLGRVAVTPVFLESNGQTDASTEDWTPALIESTLQKIQAGLNWWVDLLAAQHTVHSLEFVLDTTWATSPAATRYEPISRVSNDFALWVQEFVTGVNSDTPGGLDADIRAFNNDQRLKMNADWSFTMFIVNSNNDADGDFAAGGSFSRAFGFAGGLFLVSPSTRPASTFAHETGHMFWAKDEYAGGGGYLDRRGYYNAQNTNAADNPAPGFEQQPSIMATGPLLDTAFQNHVSPESTLAMIGWRDSDHDGIYDVLDVPLKLTGTGYFDSAAGAYKFHGAAKVGVLPNINSDGLRNDITLNRITTIQYRIDDGNWTTASEPNAYEADLDLSIALASSGQTIEFRAIDARTGVTSNVFQGRLGRADAVTAPGINGFVWTDANGNRSRDAGEFGEAGWSVEVLSATGQPLELRRLVDPAVLPDGELNAQSVPGVRITAIGPDTDGRVGVFTDSTTSPSVKQFRVYSRASQSWTANWSATRTVAMRRMQVEFALPTSVVEIDAIGTSPASYGRIEAYDAAGNLLQRFTTPKLSNGQVMTMRVESPLGTIASVRIGGHANTSVQLGKLRFGPPTQVLTGENGQFSVPNLPSGTYVVKVTPPSGRYTPLLGGGDRQSTTVVAGSITNDVDFAFRSSPWRNPQNHLDVNNDQVVSALDVLLIVNDINQHGPHPLEAIALAPPPFIDVNGDSFSSALDALLIVNHINQAAAGEAEGAISDTTAGGALRGAAEIDFGGEPSADMAAEASQIPLAKDAATFAHDQVLLALPEEFGVFSPEWLAFFEAVPGRRLLRQPR